MAPGFVAGSHVLVSKWGFGNKGLYGVTLPKAEMSAEIRRGEVLVFVYPGSRDRLEYMMRAVGLPGDLVEYRDKSLSINGRSLQYRNLGPYRYALASGDVASAVMRSENIGTTEYRVLTSPDLPPLWVAHVQDFPDKSQCTYFENGFSCRVPMNHYFMLGDNRDASNDSRYWGFVPQAHLVGRVISVRDAF